jgi:hypothetical protein
MINYKWHKNNCLSVEGNNNPTFVSTNWETPWKPSFRRAGVPVKPLTRSLPNASVDSLLYVNPPCIFRFCEQRKKYRSDWNTLLDALPSLEIKLNVVFVFLGYFAQFMLRYRRFGKAYWSHSQKELRNVRNYQSMLRNILKKWRLNLQSGGSLKFHVQC